MDNIIPELKDAIKATVEEHCIDEARFGWLGPNIYQRMAEAAFTVLQNNDELNVYLQKEKLLKP